MVLTQYIGDSRTHRIPLRFQGRAFVEANHKLIFTAKSLDSDSDLVALFKLQTGEGVTFSAAMAVIEVLPEHTSLLAPQRGIQWDIQAEAPQSNAVRTVARGTLHLLRDITRGRSPNGGYYLSPLDETYYGPDGSLYLQPTI